VGSGKDSLSYLRVTHDGGYIGFGNSRSAYIPGTINHGYEDYFITKFDTEGNVLWQRLYGGSQGDYAATLQTTTDGGYIVAGLSTASNGNIDSYIIKLDATGEVIWQKMYGGLEFDLTSSIQETSDGGYIIATHSCSTDIQGATNHGGLDYYIIKLDANGDLIWQEKYGGSGVDGTFSFDQASDGGYIIVGGSDSTDITGCINNGSMDVYILKLNPESGK
jgi:hypothetical protein